MFNSLTQTWNAHTPAYLHPYTKENFIWQLKLTVAIIVGLEAYGYMQEKRLIKKMNRTTN